MLGDADGSVLGMGVGVLLGSLEWLLLSNWVGLRLGVLEGSPLGSEDGAERARGLIGPKDGTQVPGS